MPMDAEVGYECLTIVRACDHSLEDGSYKYIDLSGESVIDKERLNDCGVYIVVGEYIKMVSTEEGSAGTIKDKHVCGVYSTRKKAEKLGKWLVEQKEWNGVTYTGYKIENFFVLK